MRSSANTPQNRVAFTLGKIKTAIYAIEIMGMGELKRSDLKKDLNLKAPKP